MTKTTELAVIQPDLFEKFCKIEAVKKEKIDFLKTYSSLLKNNLFTKIENENILSLISSILVERYYLPLEDIQEYQKLISFLPKENHNESEVSTIGILSTMIGFLNIAPDEKANKKVKRIDSYRQYL